MDMNQVVIASMMAAMGNHTNAPLEPRAIKHITFNSIRANKIKFEKDFGELVICADDTNYWRKNDFPYYKARRKEDQKKSEINWSELFKIMAEVRNDIKENFHYKLIQVPHAEADDIIGTLVHKHGAIINASNSEPILILSGDKDFIQLHSYANVKQWSPAQKKWIGSNDPDKFLFEHILKGDRDDGVPNILSPDNSLAMKIRQKPITKGRIERWNSGDFTEEEQKRFDRNAKLIDLTHTPKNIQDEILSQFAVEKPMNRAKIRKYFVKNSLGDLYKQINDF